MSLREAISRVNSQLPDFTPQEIAQAHTKDPALGDAMSAITFAKRQLQKAQRKLGRK